MKNAVLTDFLLHAIEANGSRRKPSAFVCGFAVEVCGHRHGSFSLCTTTTTRTWAVDVELTEDNSYEGDRLEAQGGGTDSGGPMRAGPERVGAFHTPAILRNRGYTWGSGIFYRNTIFTIKTINTILANLVVPGALDTETIDTVEQSRQGSSRGSQRPSCSLCRKAWSTFQPVSVSSICF